MELLKHTLFINLDHRTDRYQHAMQEFAKIGIEGYVERFSAVRTASGNIGCTMSHIKCLETAIHRNYPYVFICEDDITFTNPELFMENLTKVYNNSNIEWDVLVVGGNTCPPFQPITDYCVRVFNVQTTTGYIVKQHYYQKLLDNFREGVNHLLREPEKKKIYSIDIYWKSLQMMDQWIIMIPLTVIQYIDYSDIEGQVVNYSGMMLDLEKKALLEYLKKKEEENKMKQFFTINYT